MSMVSLITLLLATAHIPCVAAALEASTFVESPAAAAYHGKPVKVDFHSAPSAPDDYTDTSALKAMLRRFGDAIQFEPHMTILPGSNTPPLCRDSDDSDPDHLREGCHDHCLNYGRYCDVRSFIHRENKQDKLKNLLGNQLVTESARRMCIWKEYGKKNPDFFFKYIDLMVATGCDTQLEAQCEDSVFLGLGFDGDKVNRCMGSVGPNVNEKSPILEEAVKEEGVVTMGSLARLPWMVVNDQALALSEGMTRARNHLERLCNTFPNDARKPKVCDFCLNHCTEKDADSDMSICLWELRCGDGSTFEEYLESIGETPESVIAEAKIASTDGMGPVITFFAVLLALIALSLGQMAYRTYRSQRIIDRYIHQQQELRTMSDWSGVNNHLDPNIFPGENELDLNVEPTLQYSDHIGHQKGPLQPSSSTFLPRFLS